MIEEWRSLSFLDLPKYEVSNFGKVRCSYWNPARQLSIGTVNSYAVVWIKRTMFEVHRLVALAFIPNPNNLPIVHHKDENKMNPRLDNLEWTTNMENCRQSGCGSRNHQSKLTEDDVVYIRQVFKPYSKMNGTKALANRYSVSEQTIRNIVKKKYWNHI